MASGQAPAQPCSCFGALPDEVILDILESLSTYRDVVRFTSACSRTYRLYQQHKRSVLAHVIGNVVFRSNMDIAFITFALLRVSLGDLPEAISSWMSIADQPQLVARYYLSDFSLQREFLLLAEKVNRLCETYGRVRTPEYSWRKLAYDFIAFCPNSEAPVSVRRSKGDNAGRSEIASRF